MADSLEVFLTAFRQELASLPDEDREKRLDLISDQLARDMAVLLERGLDEDTATSAAIHKFNSVHRSALFSTPEQKDPFSGRLSPTVSTALYCAFAGKVIAFGLAYLFWWILCFLSSTPSSPLGLITIGTDSFPSLVAAIAAGVLLLFHDGISGMVSNVLSTRSLPGIGVRWSAIKQVFMMLLTIALMLVLREAFENESPAALLLAVALVLLMPGAWFFAGWLAARTSPQTGITAVTTAAITTGVLSFADQCFFIVVDFADSPIAFRAGVLILLLLTQVLLAGLAVVGAHIGSVDSPPKKS